MILGKATNILVVYSDRPQISFTLTVFFTIDFSSFESTEVELRTSNIIKFIYLLAVFGP